MSYYRSPPATSSIYHEPYQTARSHWLQGTSVVHGAVHGAAEVRVDRALPAAGKEADSLQPESTQSVPQFGRISRIGTKHGGSHTVPRVSTAINDASPSK